MSNNPLSYTYCPSGDEHLPQHNGEKFRISASGIANFIDYTSSWYAEHLLGADGFTGNVASVSGTVVHYLAEKHSTTGIQPHHTQFAHEYVEEESLNNPEVTKDSVLAKVKPMWAVLKQYLSANPSSLSEPYIESPTQHNYIVAGGSIDSIIDLTDPTAKYTSLDQLPRGHEYKLVDYKTTSAKQAPKSFSKRYNWQLLVYANALKEIGINVTQIELIFILQEHIGEISPKTGKQLKSYPAQVVPITKPVLSEDILFIKSLISLISDSVHRFVTTPTDRFLLAQDNRLKLDTTPIHFPAMDQTDDEVI